MTLPTFKVAATSPGKRGFLLLIRQFYGVGMLLNLREPSIYIIIISRSSSSNSTSSITGENLNMRWAWSAVINTECPLEAGT